MERIVYKDCEVCEGKGWHLVGESDDQVECSDCAFKNGAEAMLSACRSEFTKHGTYSKVEIGLRLAAIDPATLTQPPLCMCEYIDVKFCGHETHCHLHAEAVTA